MLWTWCSRSDDVDANKTLQDVIPPASDDWLIDAAVVEHKTLQKMRSAGGGWWYWCSCFFSTKLLKQASSCDNPDRGVLIVRDMREKRKSNSTTWLRRSAKNCMEKGRTPGAIRNNKNSNKTTPPNRKRQLLQNHNDNRQKKERQRDRDREQASKH